MYHFLQAIHNESIGLYPLSKHKFVSDSNKTGAENTIPCLFYEVLVMR